MTSATYLDNWIPIEWDSDVIQRVQLESAVERHGVPVSMGSATKRVLRSGGVSVAAGTTYTDDTSVNDYITLTARRFISRVTVDEDDLHDAESIVNALQVKGVDWAISYADVFDNACLGVTAAENGTTVPFTSAYKLLRTTDTTLDPDYTAGDNYTTWTTTNESFPASGGGTSLYEKLSTTFSTYEKGKYYSASDALVIAAPGWKNYLRLCADGQGRPIFQQGLAGNPDELFGVPISWSRGAKTSATNTDSPTGNDLLYVLNSRFLKKGVRSGPEFLIDAARAQDNTDDTSLKMRSRRGFALGHPSAAALLEAV
jgi:HK97 family phage major capsid protein